MDFLSKVRESPNYERLRISVEATACKKDCLVTGILAFFFTLFLCIPNDDADVIILWLLYLLGILPLFLYFLYKLVEIFLYINCYSFTETVLDCPRQGYKGAMYFTVTLRDRQGREVKVDTRHIFSQGTPNFEEYANQRALIGYNDKTEQVVVVKKLP